MTTPVLNPTLDWKSRHDERSIAYGIAPKLDMEAPLVDRMWAPGLMLNQKNEGACVGFAFASEALAEPIPVDLTRLKANVPPTWDLFARFLYGMARYLDPWPGEDYEGTSVLAGAKAAQNVGLLPAYRWAFGLDEVVRTVVQKGPVVLGTNWYSDMYAPKSGIVTPTGSLVGGHAYLLCGYRTSVPQLDGAPGAVIKNSWGTTWGLNGLATISLPHLNTLLQQDGEACVPVSRSYGR